MTVKLHPTALKLAEHAMRSFHIILPAGVTVEDMKKPEFWSHVGEKVKPMDRIEAYAEDGSFYAEFMVLDSARLWAKVRLMREVSLVQEVEGEVEVTAPEFEIKWGGPAKKHGVRRISDGQWVKQDCGTAEEAVSWLNDYKKALAR